MDAIREVGPGQHFLGCTHTQAEYEMPPMDVATGEAILDNVNRRKASFADSNVQGAGMKPTCSIFPRCSLPSVRCCAPCR
jgi:trimethylamine:corrinoid methyltransferase-like protein